MNGTARYRFLPWARRGLAGSVASLDDGGPLPARGEVSVGITVSNVPPAGVDLSLYGPGDVLGLDTRLVVRTLPRAGATNVEPNYLAGIEFDPPDFVWMFTPARADDRQRLRPWLVLIIVDRARVAPPRADRARPLPVLTIPAEVAARELPDLAESWAWAHAQLTTGEGEVDLARELEANPDLNVSRLLCPRRLEPNRQYVACLVPAFDAGVERGLGGTPDPARPLGPAWPADPGQVVLPVYYHWEFATGPQGDFETLARRLRPFQSPATVGTAPMYLGDGGPELPFLPPDDAAATVLMDGVLRAPAQSPRTLAEIPDALETGLQIALDAPAAQLAEGPSDATPALGPPIYGQWHARRHRIGEARSGWLAEANLDPRGRVAAGLGAEMVRRHQEDFMQRCWEQVGDVLRANTRLTWGRLSLEAERHVYARHYRVLPAARLLQVTSPLHRRTLHLDRTVTAQVRGSSMPDALTDGAFRRFTAPLRPLLRRLDHRARNDGAGVAGPALVRTLAAGTERVDPTRFLPDGLTGTRLADAVLADEVSEVAGTVVDQAAARSLREAGAPFVGRDFHSTPLQIGVRDSLRASGLVTAAQVDNVRLLTDGGAQSPGLNVHGAIGALIEQTLAHPEAQGFLLTASDAAPLFQPIVVDGAGSVFVGDLATPVGHLDLDSFDVDLDTILSSLPPNLLRPGVALQPRIRGGRAGSVVVEGGARPFVVPLGGAGPVLGPGLPGGFPPVGPHLPPDLVPPVGPDLPDLVPPVGPDLPDLVPPGPIQPGGGADLPELDPTNTVPMPVRDAAALRRFERAAKAMIEEQRFNEPVDLGRVVPFALDAVAGTLVARLDPAVMVPRRLQQLVGLEAGELWQAQARPEVGVWLSAARDRVMAAPDLPMPMYSFLAEESQERFCPGIGVVPPDSVTVLETNPRFIEAFMLGLNVEMNRELLWREYPTDQRGTPFRHFWDWTDGQPDIPPIHTWALAAGLGEIARGAGEEGQIVLLVRGELLRRYPNAVMLAWRARPNGAQLEDPPGPGAVLEPVFQGRLRPDITFAGFPLGQDALTAGGGWFFVIQEQPTEPRFGLDDGEAPAGAPASWRDASWQHSGVLPGGHLRVSDAGALTGLALENLRFGENGAHMASITLQQPMRIAVHARHLLV